MIGQLLAMKYIGKKPWGIAATYWILGLIIWVFDIIAAHYAWKVPWNEAVKIWVLGFVFDIIIIAILWTTFFAGFFASLPTESLLGPITGLPGYFLGW